jgi:membrane-bound lytic murein transglycosylase B
MSPGPAFADYSERADVRDYLAELVREHGFVEAELAELFADAERQQGILDAIARPAERVLKWHEYRNIFIEEQRIAQGLEFWDRHAATLEEAERTFGVPPEYVLAILGVETRYGRVTGRYRVIDALATLAFDYPPRAGFFRRELTQFLLLAREEGRNPLSLNGSYAGAMGFGQFIPSSYRHYAVDFDGDGLRDIWNNPADAVGSIANYFREHGWQAGGTVVVPLGVTAAAPSSELDALAGDALTLPHSVADLESRGLPATGLEPGTRAALFRTDHEDGVRYWLGLNNFYVITRYNRSRLYALAVHELSQDILARRRAQLAER